MRYEADPFVEVIEMEKGVWSLLSPGRCSTLCYLVEGQDSALLIDTGFGVGDMKGLCEFLAPGKPLTVVDTHFHGDHTLGNFLFDRVYIHENDYEPTLEINQRVKENGPAGGPGYTAADSAPYKDYELVPIQEGHIFDLGGGHEVEVIHTPGHSGGCIVLLEKKRRILFTGDSLVRTPTLIFMAQHPLGNVESFRDSLVRLAARKGEFDVLYPAHNLTPQPVELVDDMIALCGQILEDPDRFGRWDDPFGDRAHAKLGNYGRAYIAYNNEHVYKKKA